MYKNSVVNGRKQKEQKSEGLALTPSVTYCHRSAAEPRTVAFNSNIYFCPMSLGQLSGYANLGQAWLRVVGRAHVICGWQGHQPGAGCCLVASTSRELFSMPHSTLAQTCLKWGSRHLRESIQVCVCVCVREREREREQKPTKPLGTQTQPSTLSLPPHSIGQSTCQGQQDQEIEKYSSSLIGGAKHSYLKGRGNREGCRIGAVFVLKPSVLLQPTPPFMSSKACRQLPYLEFFWKLILRQGSKCKLFGQYWEMLVEKWGKERGKERIFFSCQAPAMDN